MGISSYTLMFLLAPGGHSEMTELSLIKKFTPVCLLSNLH